MKVVIDQSGCISCGQCEDTCPEVFKLNNEMIAEVIKQPNEITPKVQEAIDGCPVSVISVEE